MITRPCLCLLVCLALVGCSSSKRSPIPWPDRLLVQTEASIGGVPVRLLLPKEVGQFDDPKGVIWRDVSTDYAFFIKVFAGEHPASLADAVATVDLEEGASIIEKETIIDGYRVVIEEPGNQRHTVKVWKARGDQAVLCHAILGEKIGDRAMVVKSNQWIAKICGSLEITE